MQSDLASTQSYLKPLTFRWLRFNKSTSPIEFRFLMLFGSALPFLLGAAQARVPVQNIDADTPLVRRDINDTDINSNSTAYTPKVVIINFTAEELDTFEANTPIEFSNTISIPGLSPLYPDIGCNEDYSVCYTVAGENEINSAISVSALLSSSDFDFSETYFIVAGTGAIDPGFGGLGSVVFSRYTVSVDLQNYINYKEAPKSWNSSFYPYGTNAPGQFPTEWVGSEVFEVNDNLRKHLAQLASDKATLNVSSVSNFTDLLYSNTSLPNNTFFNSSAFNVTLNSTINGTANATAIAIANITGPDYLTNVTAATGPVILECDSATSNVVFNGNIAASSISNLTNVLTNGTGSFCILAKEDSAVLEAAVRYSIYGLTDYSRWVLLRAGSRFDRPPVQYANETLAFSSSNSTDATDLAIENLYTVVETIVGDIVMNWDDVYADATYVSTSGSKNGTYAPENYIGDIFGSLGGTPDFGPGDDYEYPTITVY